MAKHTQTIRRQSVFGHFVKLALKRLAGLEISLLQGNERSLPQLSQPTCTCSKLTIETLEQGVKYVQS